MTDLMVLGQTVKAWKRGDSGSSDTVMGCSSTRHRNKGGTRKVVKLTIHLTHPLDEIQRKNDSVCGAIPTQCPQDGCGYWIRIGDCPLCSRGFR